MRTAFTTLQFQTTNYDSSWQNIFNQINRTERGFLLSVLSKYSKISLYQHHLTKSPSIPDLILQNSSVLIDKEPEFTL